MRTEIPGYNPQHLSNYSFDSGSGVPVAPVPTDSLPPGFVPVTPPMPSNTPIPVPSNTPIPIPIPSRGPIYVPSNTPVPVPPPSNPLPIPAPSNTPVPVIPPRNPLPVPYKEALPIPHNNPLPIPPRTGSSPVPPRSGSSSSMRYNEAPIPAGVVYPEPPSRRTYTPRHSTFGSPTSSRRGRRLDVRSPSERLSPLPINFQFFAPLRSETTASEPRSF